MPAFCRNWWITATADGCSPKATGPRSIHQGFTVKISQRSGGSPVDALTVEGNVSRDGQLTMNVFDNTGHVVHSYRTER